MKRKYDRNDFLIFSTAPLKKELKYKEPMQKHPVVRAP